MYIANFNKITLNFKRPSGTSRGVLTQKDSWILSLHEKKTPKTVGSGEASIIKSLSPEWNNQYESKLNEVAENINLYIHNLGLLNSFPSIKFAIECALLDLKNGGQNLLYPTVFNDPNPKIEINGLIWMGTEDYMISQIKEKIKAGFSCIKMKIGAIDFEKEIKILKAIRNQFDAKEIELRVDANGAFLFEEALEKLKRLAELDLHSIEQPIKQGQPNQMADLCAHSPIPIALDEELIGVIEHKDKSTLLETIQPQFIILKPSLIGGLSGTDEWIQIAEKMGIKWWITSALESNIGLNAIAQYTYTKKNALPQGLGTGSLYTNNIAPFLKVTTGHLYLSLE